MKILTKTALTAAIAAAMSVAPAQAQTWTNSSGTPLPLGTPITVAGPLIFQPVHYPNPKTCNVSFEGTVTAFNTITFTHGTPGFVANCSPDFEGDVEFPFDVKAQFSGASFTGEYATAIGVTFQTPAASCSTAAISFAWYDSSISEGQLHSGVSALPCVLKAGSRLQVVGALAGNVDIR